MSGLLIFSLIVINFIAIWKIYEKAGIKGWRMYVPILGFFDFLKIIKRPWWWSLLVLIPFVNILVICVFIFDLAKAFGKGIGFSFLIFLGIGIPILGFSNEIHHQDTQITPISPPSSNTELPVQKEITPSSSSNDAKKEPKQRVGLFGKMQATGALEKNNFVGTSTEKQIFGVLCFIVVLVLTVIQVKRLSSLDIDDLISTSENYFIQKNYTLASKSLNKLELKIIPDTFDEYITRGLLLKYKIALQERNYVEAENALEELRKNNINNLPKEFFYKIYLAHLELSETYYLNKEFEKSKLINITLFEKFQSIFPLESLMYDKRFKVKYTEDLKYVFDYCYKRLSVYSIPENVYRSQFKNQKSLLAYEKYRDNILTKAEKIPDIEFETAIKYLPVALISNPNQMMVLLNGLTRNYQNKFQAQRIKKVIDFKIAPKMEEDKLIFQSEDLIFLPGDTSKLKPKDIESCYTQNTTSTESDKENYENFYLPVTNSVALANCKQNLYQLNFLVKEGESFKELQPKAIQSRTF